MTRPEPHHGDARIVYVSDPSTIAINLLPDPTTEQDLRRWVDMLADAGVDMFNQEIFSQGFTAYWRSDTYEYDRRKQHSRFANLFAAGIEPVDILIDQSHRRGMQFIAGFRMNDGHGYQARQQGVGISAFIESHPNLRLPPYRDGTGTLQQGDALDFSFPQVRDFTLGVIAESAERFDIDGVELCFRDRAYFPDDTGRDRAELMTELVSRIRERLAGRLLGVRVQATIDECLMLGLDVPTWIKQGLIDYVSPQDVMYCDFNLPVAQWSQLTNNINTRLYPAMLPWTSYRARYRRKRIPLSSANCRALAHSYYHAGANGISIYNHMCAAVWHPPFYGQALQVFWQMRGEASLPGGQRHYIFDPTWGDQSMFGAEGMARTGVMKAQRITLDRTTPNRSGTFHFVLYEDLKKAHGASLLFRGRNLKTGDTLQVKLNGHIVPDEIIGRTGIL